MDILHEWKLEKYAFSANQGVQSQIKAGWIDIDDKKLSLKILSARKLIISSETEVLESVSLFNCALWLKCYVKGSVLLMLHKVKDSTRKFRFKLAASRGRPAEQVLEEAVRVLRQYLPVNDLSQGSSQGDSGGAFPVAESAGAELPTLLSGEVAQSDLAKATLGTSALKLPAAYRSCEYPTEGLETLVRLCLMDPSFPAFVDCVEKALDKVTE